MGLEKVFGGLYINLNKCFKINYPFFKWGIGQYTWIFGYQCVWRSKIVCVLVWQVGASLFSLHTIDIKERKSFVHLRKKEHHPLKGVSLFAFVHCCRLELVCLKRHPQVLCTFFILSYSSKQLWLILGYFRF